MPRPLLQGVLENRCSENFDKILEKIWWKTFHVLKLNINSFLVFYCSYSSKHPLNWHLKVSNSITDIQKNDDFYLNVNLFKFMDV